MLESVIGILISLTPNLTIFPLVLLFPSLSQPLSVAPSVFLHAQVSWNLKGISLILFYPEVIITFFPFPSGIQAKSLKLAALSVSSFIYLLVHYNPDTTLYILDYNSSKTAQVTEYPKSKV